MTSLDGNPPAASELHRSARRHGTYRWIERRLYELTGAWSAAAGSSDAARVHLFEMSARHAWHADLWADRLPVLAGVDTDDLTRPSGPVLEPLFQAVAAAATVGADGPDAAEPPPATGRAAELRRLSALYRVVLPRLLVTYRAHLASAAPVTDGPTIRALSLVVRDEAEQLGEGEALLETLLRTPSDVETAAASQRSLELLLVEGAPAPGLLPWPRADFAGEAPPTLRRA